MEGGLATLEEGDLLSIPPRRARPDAYRCTTFQVSGIYYEAPLPTGFLFREDLPKMTPLSFSTLLASASLFQGALHVPGDFPTIQTAITAARPGDLVLVAPGTYNEQIDFLGKAISVIGTAGAGETVIDASGLGGWYDWPYDPIVRFINGETAGSVLQGFTLTGHDLPFAFSAPVYSTGTPTLVGCRIEGNTGMFSGGFYGGGTLSGCSVTGNASANGGSVTGDLELFDCVIESNWCYDESHGGGINAWPGLRAVRCTIINNAAGASGHSGGGSYGPAVLEDCLIANNEGNSWGGQNEGGAAAVHGALLVDGCTIVGNVFEGVGGYTVSADTIVNTIVWNNTDGLGNVLSGAADYSCVQDGAVAGMGNIALDPLFVDELGGDYRLQLGSPCIDAGDPGGDTDPDGTPRDMGAFFAPQYPAQATPRFGPDFHFDCTALSLPVLGSTFQVQVTADAGETLTVFFVHALPTSPLPTPYGDLLVDVSSPRFVLHAAVPSGGASVHSLPIPANQDLVGLQAYAQALRIGGSLQLTNGLDLRLGL